MPNTGKHSSQQPGPEVRNTRQRRTVVSTLENTEDFHSAQALHRSIVDAGEKVSLATVYRILQSLTEQGVVDAVYDDDGQALYRMCATEHHHHHLRCRRCGAAEELEAEQVEAWAEQIGARYGFSEIDHRIELSGLCPRCTAELSR